MPKKPRPLKDFSPLFKARSFSARDKKNLSPFFTNLTKSVYVPLIFSPEVVGALCSRTSRAADDLRPIFLNEYINPFLFPTGTPAEKKEMRKYGQELKHLIAFLRQHPIEKIFSNPKARSFYAKWLAQYGDDSIAQMAGSHIVFSSLSQVAIKQFEDQRIGLAPIEKSTRYVNYSQKINGQYQYYVDPTLKDLGLEKAYRAAMDNLFETYMELLPQLTAYLSQKFPQEKPSVVEKKAFDTLRGLLPTSTLSQVAFFGNGQAFEYAVSRSARHPLGEIRWAAEEMYQELFKVTPSFLRRIKDADRQDLVTAYQDYLSQKPHRLMPLVKKFLSQVNKKVKAGSQAKVQLIEFDKDGETKILAGMLYNAPNNQATWQQTLSAVKKMSKQDKQAILTKYLSGRAQRWQKVGRAFENSYLRYEITMNIGGWRDLHRHRMLTQQRQHFTVKHGYDVPPELIESGLDTAFRAAINKVEAVYHKIAAKDLDLAQYAVTLAHRLHFMQWTNMRELFWEVELRTIPEGHPDYRHIEQEKFNLLAPHFPLIAEHMRVNLGEYDFARRGQEEKIQQKLKELEKLNK
jgi:thymidylate synthase ThyX